MMRAGIVMHVEWACGTVVPVRTTIDLPDELHEIARSIARDRGISLSEAVTELMRRALGSPAAPELGRSSATGLPTVRIGRVVTSDDVRSLEDDDGR